MIISEANYSAYFVGYADLPRKIANPDDTQKGLSNLVKGIVENIKGEIKSEKESSLNGFPCRDFEADGKVQSAADKSQSTDVSMKGRFCLADIRQYQVFTLGAKDKFSTSDADIFITSFKIEK